MAAEWPISVRKSSVKHDREDQGSIPRVRISQKAGVGDGLLGLMREAGAGEGARSRVYKSLAGPHEATWVILSGTFYGLFGPWNLCLQ